MTALGNKIKEDNKSNSTAFIWVFTDKKAIELKDKVLSDTLSKSDTDLYDNNFVGVYKKNGSTGFHEFLFYLDGVNGSNYRKIEY